MASTKLDQGQDLPWQGPFWGSESVNLASTNWTPSSTDKNGKPAMGRGLYVTVAGNVTIVLPDGTSFTFAAASTTFYSSVAGPNMIPMFTQVTKATTTATGITAFF